MAESLARQLMPQATNPVSRIVKNLESSQLPASQHDIYLLRFLCLPVTYQMVAYVAAYTNAIVEDVLPTLPSSSSSSTGVRMPELEDFILHVCRQSNVSTSVLMVSVIYLARLRNSMPFQAHAVPGTAHRLFLAALIISSKYSNDSSAKNKGWVQVSAGLFDLAEVNLMERQFLFLIDFDLMFDEAEAIWHFQPVLEVLGADLRDADAYSRAKKENNIKYAPPPLRKAVLSVPRHEEQNVMHLDEATRQETRENALRRVSRASQDRLARMPRSTTQQSLSIASPAPVLIAPPRTSSRRAADSYPSSPLASLPSRSSFRADAASSSTSLGQAKAETPMATKRSSALSAILARAPSSDSVSSDSMSSAGGLTADESTSSSSASMTSEEELDADDDVVRVVATLNVDEEMKDGSLHVDMTGIGATAAAKKKLYGALQQQQSNTVMAGGVRRPSRFGWTRRRSESLKPAAGDEAADRRSSQNRPEFHYHQSSSPDSFVAERKPSSSRRNSRTAFTSSASTIVGMGGVSDASSLHAIGAAPINRHASSATIVPSRSRSSSFRDMGIPIITASASTGGPKQQQQRAPSSAAKSGGMSISASIRSFLTGGGSANERAPASLPVHH